LAEATRKEGVSWPSSLQLGIWFTLLKVYAGQIETAGGQEGRSEVCQLILQLSYKVYLAAGG
jgi:hypothetical protein